MNGKDRAEVEEPLLVVLEQVAEVHNGITAVFEALGQPGEQEENRARETGLVASIVEAAYSLAAANCRLRELEKVIRDAVRRMGE